jgi:hypothetical protein
MLLLIALSGITIFLFFVYFFKSKCTREAYILFTVYFFPLMSLGVTSEAFGGLKIFDALSYFSFIFFIQDFFIISKKNKIYFYLFNLLIVILFVGSLHSEFIKHSLLTLLSVFPIFIFSRLLIKELSINPELRRKIIWGFQLSFFIGIIFMTAQILVGLQFTFYPDLNPNITTSEGIRYPGFFADAQVNALFFAMMSFLFLINFKNISKPGAIHFFLFGSALVAMFFSGGRAAFLGVCMGLVFLLLFFSWRLKYFITLSTLAVLAVIPFLKDSFVLFQRLGGFNESYQFRSYIWKEAYEIYTNHQFLGIGIGNYKDYVERYSSDQYYVLEDNSILVMDQPENGYLKILTEAGLLGFMISFLFIILPVAKALYGHFAVKKNYMTLLFIAPIVCWLVSFNSLYTLSDRRIEILLVSLICFIIAKGVEPVKKDRETTY